MRAVAKIFYFMDIDISRLFRKFAYGFRLNVGVCLISSHLFGCPVPTFYQLTLGCINVFNFIKSLFDMKTLGSFLKRWAVSVMGGQLYRRNAR